MNQIHIKCDAAILLFLFAGVVSCFCAPPDPRDTLNQISTINAVLDGRYDGVITCGDLKTLGDVGIGTFDALDGEMVLLTGVVFQALADGSVTQAEDSATSPFACVTFFEEDVPVRINNTTNLAELCNELDKLIIDKNIPCAVRLRGAFAYVKTRSVPPQKKPYPKLVEVTAHQPEFEFHNVTGDLIGFWSPAWVQALNVPGYHLHFLTDNRAGGGHLLDCRITEAKGGLDLTPAFLLQLPHDATQGVDLTNNRKKELEAAEKSTK